MKIPLIDGDQLENSSTDCSEEPKPPESLGHPCVTENTKPLLTPAGETLDMTPRVSIPLNHPEPLSPEPLSPEPLSPEPQSPESQSPEPPSPEPSPNSTTVSNEQYQRVQKVLVFCSEAVSFSHSKVQHVATSIVCLLAQIQMKTLAIIAKHVHTLLRRLPNSAHDHVRRKLKGVCSHRA